MGDAPRIWQPQWGLDAAIPHVRHQAQGMTLDCFFFLLSHSCALPFLF